MDAAAVNSGNPDDRRQPEIPLHQVFMPEDHEPLLDSLRETLSSGWIGEGPRVRQFEQALGQVLGSPRVSLVNSGTSALHLALRLAGVGIGDEVVTTPMTCVATNMPILTAGAAAVWADVDPQTGNLDPASLEQVIGPLTRAIMVVHWGGYPADLEEIRALARERGLAVIEDCAHALGTTYRGLPIGSDADFACFSLQAVKHITSGDGGILVCGDEASHERARRLRWYGIDRDDRPLGALGVSESDISEAGYKFHMNDIAATIGLWQLPHLAENVARRRANAQWLRSQLSDLDRVRLPPEQSDRQSSYWLFTLLVDDQVAFIAQLRRAGIEGSIVHERNDRHRVFASSQRVELPGLDEFASHMVCIPVGPWLAAVHLERMAQVIREQAW